jgi:hypothetical protein
MFREATVTDVRIIVPLSLAGSSPRLRSRSTASGNLQNPRWPGRDRARRPESRSKYIGSLPNRASVDDPDPGANMLLCAPLLTCLPL